MTRTTLAAPNRAESTKPSLRIAEFAEFSFPNGAIRCTTADRNIDWGGYTWLASAVLRDTGGFAEAADLKSRRVSIRLSGLDATLITRILNDNYQYSRVQFWLGFFDENWVLVANPHAIGEELLMSGVSLVLGRQLGDAELSAESWEIFSAKNSAVLATPESQRLRYPGDTGQDLVADIATKAIEWGGGTRNPRHSDTGVVASGGNTAGGHGLNP